MRVVSSALARRLLISIVLFSSLVTLLLTAGQLYLDYRHDLSGIDARLQQIRDVHRDSIENSLWALDEQEAQVLIDGILQLPDMVYLEVHDGNRSWATGGSEPRENFIESSFELFSPNPESAGAEVIGSLRVVATLQQVYQRLFDKAVTLLISNAIKTFLVAGFILVFVNWLITRHLHAVYEYMREQDIDDATALEVERKFPFSSGRDELDMVIDGLNSMRLGLKDSFEKLREAEQGYRALYDNMAQGVIYQDTDGKVLSVNIAGCEILGMSESQLIGKSGIDPETKAIHESGEPFALKHQPAMIALREAKIVHNVIMGLYHPSRQEYRWILVNSRPEFKPGEDRPWRVFSTFTDITERKRVERERGLLIKELEAKNTRLERFAYTVSHELKSPLVTIAGFTGMLRQDLARGDAQRSESSFTQIERATETMSLLLEDLLKLARIGHVENTHEAVSLTDLARDASRHLQFEERARNIEIDIDPDMPTVMGDRPRLLEVMQNLIENAVKFSAGIPQAKVSVRAELRDGEVVCSVQDNGRGIAPEYHERIFNLFERLDQVVEGTGVGLALVRGIVESHNGRVWIESDGEGTGCKFYFSLPAQAEVRLAAN